MSLSDKSKFIEYIYNEVLQLPHEYDNPETVIKDAKLLASNTGVSVIEALKAIEVYRNSIQTKFHYTRILKDSYTSRILDCLD
jgi:hypothetical protein